MLGLMSKVSQAVLSLSREQHSACMAWGKAPAKTLCNETGSLERLGLGPQGKQEGRLPI